MPALPRSIRRLSLAALTGLAITACGDERVPTGSIGDAVADAATDAADAATDAEPGDDAEPADATPDSVADAGPDDAEGADATDSDEVGADADSDAGDRDAGGSDTDGDAADGTRVDVDVASDADTDADTDTTPPDPGFVVRGNVFWNQPSLPEGRLVVGIVSGEVVPPPVASATSDPAVLPTVYQFSELAEGDYRVFAFLDVGDPNTFDAPGEGDLVTVSASVGVGPTRPVVSDINVELRPGE